MEAFLSHLFCLVCYCCSMYEHIIVENNKNKSIPLSKLIFFYFDNILFFRFSVPEVPRRRPVDPALLEPPSRQIMATRTKTDKMPKRINHLRFKDMSDKEIVQTIMGDEEMMRQLKNSDMPHIIIMPRERDEMNGPLVTLNIGGGKDSAGNFDNTDDEGSMRETSAKLLLQAQKDERMHNIMMQQLAR